VLKFDLYCAINDEYLKKIISDLDDIHLDIGTLQIKNNFEDIQSLIFFKLYFRELISMGLLDESKDNKIFPGISNASETLYESINSYNKDININSFFTIPKSDSKQYIDDRNDSFSELAKLYYYLLPTAITEYHARDVFINQSFLIAYEYDSDYHFVNDDYLYFAFPILGNEMQSKNFMVDNSYLWPKISNEKVIHGEKYNNSFYKENWFMKQDYDFRIKASKQMNTKVSIFHLNYHYYGRLNKSYVNCLQNYATYNGKKYIINMIFFTKQLELKEEFYDFSTFLIMNKTDYLERNERYSDNKTYLIFKSNILEFSLSEIFYKYFHFGIYDKNDNFFKDGKSFDGFDIEKLGEPLKKYNTVKNFNIDLRLFSSLYLYTLLFIKSKYNITIKEKTEIAQFDFYENPDLVENICNEFNFTSYQEYLINEGINCWDIQNMLYYSEVEIPYDKSLYNYINIPYCICLPLY
jgi:hypothetical protein